MRWNQKNQENEKLIKKFLFFPLTINNQTRWLEFAQIRQELKEDYILECGTIVCDGMSYCNKEWVDI